MAKWNSGCRCRWSSLQFISAVKYSIRGSAPLENYRLTFLKDQNYQHLNILRRSDHHKRRRHRRKEDRIQILA